MKEMEPIGVRRPKASDMKSACISVPFDPPSVFGGGGGGGGKHGSGSHATSHRQVFEPSAWKTQPMNHASATSLSERNISTVNTPESATVAIAKSCERMVPRGRRAPSGVSVPLPCSASALGVITDLKQSRDTEPKLPFVRFSAPTSPRTRRAHRRRAKAISHPQPAAPQARMGGEVLPGTTPAGDGDAVVLCGFGGCPQVWNHKGPCEVPIMDSRRRAPRPARLDDSPERHRPEERADGDTSSAAARHGTSEDSAPKHENENGQAVSLQPAPEPRTETRPAAEPAPEHAPAAAEPRLDTQPPPEQAPVSLDAVPDDSQRPTPAPTPLPTPTPLGLPSPRPTGEAACVRGEETPAPTLVPSISPLGAVPSVSPPERLAHREVLPILYLPTPPYTSLYLPRPAWTCLYLPVPPCTSLYLPISPPESLTHREELRPRLTLIPNAYPAP